MVAMATAKRHRHRDRTCGPRRAPPPAESAADARRTATEGRRKSAQRTDAGDGSSRRPGTDQQGRHHQECGEQRSERQVEPGRLPRQPDGNDRDGKQQQRGSHPEPSRIFESPRRGGPQALEWRSCQGFHQRKDGRRERRHESDGDTPAKASHGSGWISVAGTPRTTDATVNRTLERAAGRRRNRRSPREPRREDRSQPPRRTIAEAIWPREAPIDRRSDITNRRCTTEVARVVATSTPPTRTEIAESATKIESQGRDHLIGKAAPFRRLRNVDIRSGTAGRPEPEDHRGSPRLSARARCGPGCQPGRAVPGPEPHQR